MTTTNNIETTNKPTHKNRIIMFISILIVIPISIIITLISRSTTTIKATDVADDSNYWDSNPLIMLSDLATPTEKELIQWGADNGCKFKSSALKWPVITKLGRGMVAARDISYGEPLFWISKSCQFKLSNAPQYLREIIAACPSNIWFPGDDFGQLTLFLMDAKVRGRNSYWFPYINALPQVIDTPTNGWNGDELHELQFDEVLREMIGSLQFREYVYSQIIQANKGNIHIANYSIHVFSYAWTVVETRAWGIPEENGRILNPFVDLLNHDASEETKVLISKERTIFYSGAVKAGEEVYNSYGKKHNRDLLYYGFALKDNVHESMEIPKYPTLKWHPFYTPIEYKFGPTPESSFNIRLRYRLCHQDLDEELNKLPTTLAYDENILWNNNNISNRKRNALAFRISRKKLIQAHVNFCKQMEEALGCLPESKIKWGNNIRLARMAWEIGYDTIVLGVGRV
jgi:hypothetical protein